MQLKCAVPNHELRSKTAPSAGDVSGKQALNPSAAARSHVG